MLLLKRRKSQSFVSSLYHHGNHHHQEGIDLSENIDESALEQYWNKVVEDLHKDPEWFTFADD